jgi:hypothetical protein
MKAIKSKHTFSLHASLNTMRIVEFFMCDFFDLPGASCGLTAFLKGREQMMRKRLSQ